MSRRLTNSDIDFKLVGRNIQRIGDYVSSKTSLKFKCLKDGCNCEWSTFPPNVTCCGNGCPRCAKKERLTNEIVDSRLKGRNIERIGEVISGESKLRFKCLINSCLNVWETKVLNVVSRGSGCPKCSGSEPLTNTVIDARLVGRNIIRVGSYTQSDKPLKFKCSIPTCGYEWYTRYGAIQSGKGCPKCSKRAPLTDEIIDTRLIGRNIIRVSPYIKHSIPFKVRCENNGCGREWSILASNLFAGKGCARCSKVERLSNEIVDVRLEGSSIQRIGEFVNVDTKITFKCLSTNCGHEWLAEPTNILHAKHGCPACSVTGFKTALPAIIYVLNIGDIYCGYGISNVFDNRIAQHEIEFRKHRVHYEVLAKFECSGTEAARIESLLKAQIPSINSGILSFKRECTNIFNANKVIDFINDQLKQCQ